MLGRKSGDDGNDYDDNFTCKVLLLNNLSAFFSGTCIPDSVLKASSLISLVTLPLNQWQKRNRDQIPCVSDWDMWKSYGEYVRGENRKADEETGKSKWRKGKEKSGEN